MNYTMFFIVNGAALFSMVAGMEEAGVLFLILWQLMTLNEKLGDKPNEHKRTYGRNANHYLFTDKE